jgi:hypothetical protein
VITAELRAFTPRGLQAFRDWLDRAEANIPRRLTAEPPPIELLFDDQYAKPVGFCGQLTQRSFQRKFDLGMEVCGVIGYENAGKLAVMPNAWAWLSLFFHETTFPKNKACLWFTGERSRHLVQTIEGRKQDQSHRHLVKSAVTNVLRFGEFAVVLMGSEIGQSKIEEQVMSRRVDPPLAHHLEFIKALHRLYWDAGAGDLKSGAGGQGPGSIMHMIDLLTQFDLTFDISSLERDDFLKLLPNDFRRFTGEQERPATSKSSRRSWLQRFRGDRGGQGEALTP